MRNVPPTYYAVGWCNRVCLQQVSEKKNGWINRRKERVKDMDRWNERQEEGSSKIRKMVDNGT